MNVEESTIEKTTVDFLQWFFNYFKGVILIENTSICQTDWRKT